MNTVTFDTYAAAKHLRDAGFDERQAEAAVSMVRDAVSADRGEIATKAGPGYGRMRRSAGWRGRELVRKASFPQPSCTVH